MRTFHEFAHERGGDTFFLEEQMQKDVSSFVREIRSVKAADVHGVIRQLNAKNLDDLVNKLLARPEIKQILQLADTKLEHNLDEGIVTSLMKGVGTMVWWAVSAATKTLAEGIKHIFASQASDIHQTQKLRHVAIIVLTFIIAPFAMSIGGAPLAAATAAPLGLYLLSWFAANILKPAVEALGH